MVQGGMTAQEPGSRPAAVKRGTWLGWALSAVFGVLLLALVALRMPVVPRHFLVTAPEWLYVALALQVPYMLLRATRLRWCLRLAPEHRVKEETREGDAGTRPTEEISTALLIGSGFVGFFMTMLLPLRLGEFARPALLARAKPGLVDFARGLGAITVERLIDGLFVVGLLFVGIWLHPPVSGQLGADWVLWAGRTTALTFGVALVVLVLITARPHWVLRARAMLPSGALLDAVASAATRFTVPLRALAQPRWSVPFLLESLGYWALTVVQLQCVALSVGLSLDLAGAAVVVAIIGLSIQIPGGPAQVGSYQVGALGALALLAPAQLDGPGAVFAALMYAVQVVGVTLFAPIGVLLLRRDRRLDLVQESRREPNLSAAATTSASTSNP